jgi:hypothetical protein
VKSIVHQLTCLCTPRRVAVSKVSKFWNDAPRQSVFHFRRHLGETMKMQRIGIAIWTMALSVSAPVLANGTHAAQAVGHSGKASAHASGSAAHAIAASGKTTSAVVAVPLSVGGAVLSTAGAVSMAVGGQLSTAASAAPGPLPITEETITTTPPDQALRATAAPR